MLKYPWGSQLMASRLVVRLVEVRRLVGGMGARHLGAVQGALEESVEDWFGEESSGYRWKKTVPSYMPWSFAVGPAAWTTRRDARGIVRIGLDEREETPQSAGATRAEGATPRRGGGQHLEGRDTSRRDARG